MAEGYYKREHLPHFGDIAEGGSELAKKFFDYYEAVFAAGALTEREKALIALAVAHAVQPAGRGNVRLFDRGAAALECRGLRTGRSAKTPHAHVESRRGVSRGEPGEPRARVERGTPAGARSRVRPAHHSQQHADRALPRVARNEREPPLLHGDSGAGVQPDDRPRSHVPQHAVGFLGRSALRFRLQPDARASDRGRRRKANACSRPRPSALRLRRIVTGRHCFGCTAGAGSSCGGSLVPLEQ